MNLSIVAVVLMISVSFNQVLGTPMEDLASENVAAAVGDCFVTHGGDDVGSGRSEDSELDYYCSVCKVDRARNPCGVCANPTKKN
ncbi:uncharacterized protein MELLADRAFT_124528 [Melampsora larici-populina 98AG31]|uniref:Secreted protein n=1 Tax=Melampsora larici-populina (strain 98AG31 / pathotype 3-4-7) TaxID=747676 RepID=F4SBM8_MELLP|nr:uncharacterized protein MELLADRAFT_124527 [Melampsora larici-populina 98AG31]XP_007418776.1 uncharacterized protein MELLADRAFT_124528 [Melampsora larici-populina 98AG31]EGF97956.1 secreted protein [Melampsora larici-populina 98AG31]EGF97957.1 secreted protein [Melampsora larici-populina 98AG31]